MGELRLAIYPRLPQTAIEATPREGDFLNDACVEKWTLRAPTGLTGVAHSITLGAATLGYLNVPGPPVEALIALSIALVAVEIVNSGKGRESLASRLPWLIAFAFGLLHGLGFAGALSKVGLPDHAIPVALLFFNLGVELGQLTFVAAVMLLFAIAHRASFLLVRRETNSMQAWLRLAGAYCIGGVASFWLVERVYYGFWA